MIEGLPVEVVFKIDTSNHIADDHHSQKASFSHQITPSLVRYITNKYTFLTGAALKNALL